MLLTTLCLYVYLQIKLPIIAVVFWGYLQDLVPSPVLISVQAFPIFPSVSPTTLLKEFSLVPQTFSSPSSKTQPFIPLNHPRSPSGHRLALATQCPFFCSALHIRWIFPLPPIPIKPPPGILPLY